MANFQNSVPFIVSLVFYFLCSIWSVGYILRPRGFNQVLSKWFMIAGFSVHSGYLLYLGIREATIPITNISESMIFLVWCIILVFLVIDFLYKLPSILAFLMPFVTAFSIWSLLFVSNDLSMPKDMQKLWLVAHIVPTFFGYASFAISCIASIMYITLQRQLRSKSPSSLLTRLPSLESLDKLVWRTLTFGFPLITLGLVFGFVWIRSSGVLGQPWYTDQKVIFGIVAWLVYASLLHIRMIASFHGTKVALLTIAGFVIIIFTFVGTFFIGSQHGFVKVDAVEVPGDNIRY